MRSEKTQFAMSGPDLSLIPGFDVFNEEAIQAYIVGKQNFRNGCRTVACGDVAAVRRLDPGSDSTYSVVVHAEKSSNKNYLVLVNDNRTYGERAGEKYKAVLDKLLPVRLPSLPDCRMLFSVLR